MAGVIHNFVDANSAWPTLTTERVPRETLRREADAEYWYYEWSNGRRRRPSVRDSTRLRAGFECRSASGSDRARLPQGWKTRKLVYAT